MKKAVLLTSSLLFAATMAIAQDSPTAGSQDPSQNATTTTTQTQTSQGSTLRGCLSGSADNFTLTDLNGTQYKLMGGDSSMQSAVGHEVEVSGTQSQAAETSSGNGETMAHAANSFQVSQVRDTGSACKMGSRSNGMSPTDHPMDEKTPKGAATTSDQPQPQLMAMLQQSNSSSSMSTTSTDTSQASQSTNSAPNSGQSAGAQTTPPVTSQTPAGSASPTSPSSTTGSSPANNTGMTSGEGNSDAQAARQGETSTNPNTGQTTGQGVNGSTSPSTAPNATPSSTNSTSPQTGTSPQANTSQPPATDDANKPLYERQATDIPYAQHGNNTSTTPSTTTTPH